MSETATASATASAARTRPANALGGSGVTAAIIAFVIWGFFPLYLKGLASVPALEITAHRIAWSCVFVLGWMAVRGELWQLGDAVRRGLLPRLIGTAALVTVNWLAFVWGTNQGHVVELSLGYYISPLINVLLGVFLLSERLTRAQWIAVALAAAGVVYITVGVGTLPWIELSVALSFAFYGFIRKIANVDALPGLGIEMIVLAPFAIGYLLWREANGLGALGHSSGPVDALLVLSAVVTALPLYLFALGAKRIPYSTIGVVQYIAPSLQLASAVLFFHESFDKTRIIGFALIWIALLVYAIDGTTRARSQRLAAAASQAR